MSKGVIISALAGAAFLAAPLTAVAAQSWTPGSEIAGHAVQVETNGVTNTVHFDPGGAARIMTPAGNMVPATWSVSNNMLCLNSSGAQECWPYSQPFQAGQPLTLTSSCQVSSRWLPLSTEQPPMQAREGERG